MSSARPLVRPTLSHRLRESRRGNAEPDRLVEVRYKARPARLADDVKTEAHCSGDALRLNPPSPQDVACDAVTGPGTVRTSPPPR